MGRLYRSVKDMIQILYKESETSKEGKIDEEVIRELTEDEELLKHIEPE